LPTRRSSDLDGTGYDQVLPAIRGPCRVGHAAADPAAHIPVCSRLRGPWPTESAACAVAVTWHRRTFSDPGPCTAVTGRTRPMGWCATSAVSVRPPALAESSRPAHPAVAVSA